MFLKYFNFLPVLGSILAPLIGALDFVDPTLPLAIYGLVVLLAGLESILIWPDTSHENLPDTCEEAEKMAQTPNKWLQLCKIF